MRRQSRNQKGRARASEQRSILKRTIKYYACDENKIKAMWEKKRRGVFCPYREVPTDSQGPPGGQLLCKIKKSLFIEVGSSKISTRVYGVECPELIQTLPLSW